ncbi:MAG TPA: rhomboid family intramembrane serine protease, partial [Humisphaera sp.]|nr:rhomboid family intramembrane serine protease [Humisphaera sp.]
LYIFGNNVNDRLGHIGYLAFYLAGGVFAALTYLVTQGQDTVMVGASGSIAAVTGAYLVLLPRSNVTIFYWLYFFGWAEISSLYFIAGFFLLDIYMNFATSDQVAHGAHIGGTVYGFMTCSALLILNLLPRDHFDVVALIQRWNRRRQYREMVSGGYNPFEYTQVTAPGKPRAAPAPPSAQTQQILDLRAKIADAIGIHDVDHATELFLQLKAIDPQQVLSRQNQLDIANHLAHQQNFQQAAEAYEMYLRQYPKSDQIEQVELMLGLVYARYLAQYAKAKEVLTRAAEKLQHNERQYSLAKDELAHIEAQLAAKPTTA